MSNSLEPKIIVIGSAVGGVGKSTIAKELALYYTKQKIDGREPKVCLVDGGFNCGVISILLKIASRPNIKTWTKDIQKKLAINPDVYPMYSQETIMKDFLIKDKSGLYVLAAPSNYADTLDINADQMGCVIENLRNCDFDVILIDTMNNTQDYTLIAFEKANVIGMVTTPDDTSFVCEGQLLSILRDIAFPVDKIKTIVNRFPEDKDSTKLINEKSDIIANPIIGVIPEYDKIREYNNDGISPTLSENNVYTSAIKVIGDKLFNTPNLEELQNTVDYQLDKLRDLYKDNHIKRIIINNYEEIYIEKDGVIERFWDCGLLISKEAVDTIISYLEQPIKELIGDGSLEFKVSDGTRIITLGNDFDDEFGNKVIIIEKK